MSDSNQPNIVMIMADQLSALALGCYGHPVAKTPNLDRLAAEGVVFVNSYCNSPLCGPSRNSMVSGRLPSAIGSYDNANELPAATLTYMHLLRREGYAVWLSGKMHFVGPDQLHGFHGRTITDIYPSAFEWTSDWRRGAYGNPGTTVRHLHHAGPCDWSLQLDYDEETHALGLRRLRDLTRQRGRDGQPFFMTFSYSHPHEPFTPAREDWDLYEDVDIPPPSAPERAMDEHHPFNQWIQTHHEIDIYPPGEETVATARRAYLAQVSYVDRKVGEVMAELERMGVDDETIVLFTSDHGDMQGEHGMWYKRTFHEWSMRVPMIAWRPGVFGAGRRIESPVSLVDLFPTLVDLGGGPNDWPGSEDFDGASLAPMMRGEADGWKRPMVAEYCGEGILQPMRMARAGDWKYVDVHEHEPLLFNLKDDPHELKNLLEQPGHCDQEASVREAFDEDYDGDALRERIMADQQQRLMLLESSAQGEPPVWDYGPRQDVSKLYVRRGFSTQTAKAQHRWPYVEEHDSRG